MSEEPKNPHDEVNSEWTADTMYHLLMSQDDDHLAHQIATAHNAAFAAERQKRYKDNERCRDKLAKAQEWEEQLRDQLAAERESRDGFRRALEQRIAEVDQLREQFAAERDSDVEPARTIRELRKQLAAEREKHEGAMHHMEACRALLNVPDDEVLYGAITAEREKYERSQEKVREYFDLLAVEQASARDCRRQLAAAVEALKEIRSHPQMYEIANTALDKIGGK